jgi:ketosteroid isomerase-like protein
MSAEENKALVRRFFEAQVQGDLDALKEMMAQDFVDHRVLPGQAADREGYIRAVAEDRVSFSNVRRIVEDQVATDDTVVSRLTLSGTHDRQCPPRANHPRRSSHTSVRPRRARSAARKTARP